MIYLSHLSLDPRSRQVQAELHDPYQMHRTLCKAFGSRPGELGIARCLFRMETLPRRGLHVVVQSLLPPHWHQLTVSRGYFLAPPETKPFHPTFAVGQRLAFRLHANPTVKREGKRLGLYREEQQRAWLERKATENGFAVCSAAVRGPDVVTCRAGEDHPAHLLGVTFDGVLRVTDPERLLHALASGIGSGKAFGFGLLSLARR